MLPCWNCLCRGLEVSHDMLDHYDAGQGCDTASTPICAGGNITQRQCPPCRTRHLERGDGAGLSSSHCEYIPLLSSQHFQGVTTVRMGQTTKLTLYHSLPNRSARVVELIEVRCSQRRSPRC